MSKYRDEGVDEAAASETKSKQIENLHVIIEKKASPGIYINANPSKFKILSLGFSDIE